MPGQSVLAASEGAAVEHDDGAARFGGAHEGFHIASETSDTGHLCLAKAIHAEGEVIGQLSGAGAS